MSLSIMSNVHIEFLKQAEKKRGRDLELEMKNQETKLRSELCTDFNRLLVETEELYKVIQSQGRQQDFRS